MRQNPKDKKIVEMFFNSIFLSIDEQVEDNNVYDSVPDQTEPYNLEILNGYLKSLMKKYLSKKEYEVLRLSYGLDSKKISANEIADIINIEGPSAYVRVSELKKQAVQKLIDNVDSNQVIDFL